jgi:hypothetical protein
MNKVLWWRAQVWNPSDSWRYKRGGTLENHVDSVSCATIVGPYLLSGGHDQTVCVSNAANVGVTELGLAPGSQGASVFPSHFRQY